MKRARDLIEQLFLNINHEDMKVYGKIFSSWTDLAGTDLAAHSRILEIDRGILFIGVDHPGWMQMISMRKAGILSSIKRQYPSLEIRDLRFMLIDGVPENELEKRFGGTENSSPEPPSQDEQAQEENSDPKPPENFQKKLEKLGKSIEKKWK
ncbi:DUF721 domain-containing protein [Marispirochaeta sp.]|jgi:hypothetical protein|uniref:DUF721 domain-containing protein n=1 Tax=Marispirochaeta sp. TaxID=2038653 RepID=UPI0029C92F5F|nr:DUF721 domain-containing protein [Marispirochaeta sp.]